MSIRMYIIGASILLSGVAFAQDQDLLGENFRSDVNAGNIKELCSKKADQIRAKFLERKASGLCLAQTENIKGADAVSLPSVTSAENYKGCGPKDKDGKPTITDIWIAYREMPASGKQPPHKQCIWGEDLYRSDGTKRIEPKVSHTGKVRYESGALRLTVNNLDGRGVTTSIIGHGNLKAVYRGHISTPTDVSIGGRPVPNPNASVLSDFAERLTYANGPLTPPQQHTSAPADGMRH